MIAAILIGLVVLTVLSALPFIGIYLARRRSLPELPPLPPKSVLDQIERRDTQHNLSPTDLLPSQSLRRRAF